MTYRKPLWSRVRRRRRKGVRWRAALQRYMASRYATGWGHRYGTEKPELVCPVRFRDAAEPQLHRRDHRRCLRHRSWTSDDGWLDCLLDPVQPRSQFHVADHTPVAAMAPCASFAAGPRQGPELPDGR